MLLWERHTIEDDCCNEQYAGKPRVPAAHQTQSTRQPVQGMQQLEVDEQQKDRQQQILNDHAKCDGTQTTAEQ